MGPAALVTRPGFLRRHCILVLAGIVLVGGALRAERAANPGVARQSTDEVSYSKLAIDLSVHGQYGARRTHLHRPFHWPPGAPFLFAAGHRLAPGPDLHGAYWLQAICGTLLILVVFGLAATLAGPAAGIGAAAVIALYPPLIALSGELLSECLGALLLAAATLCAVHAYRRSRWWWFSAAGVLWGLAILTRADFVFAPLLVTALMLLGAVRRRDLRIAALAGLFLVVTALTVAPWILYATGRQGHLVLITEGDASALFVGTYLPGKGTTYGMKRALGDEVRRRHPKMHASNWDMQAKEVLNLVAARHRDLPREKAIQREAYANLRRYPIQRPLAFARMMLDKVRRTWVLSSRVGSPAVSRPVRIGHGIIVVLSFVLAILGLWRVRDLRLAIVLAPVLYSAALHALVVAKPRYNLPPFPLLVVAGIAGTVWLLRSPSPQRHAPQERQPRVPARERLLPEEVGAAPV